eukprot:COSAG02_NODE_5953_length_3916_cov_1.450616_2_plen_155_part_00
MQAATAYIQTRRAACVSVASACALSIERTHVHVVGCGMIRLLYKELGRVCCSSGLERQLRRLGSDVHVFGHTHINWDKTHNGVRYVQHPLKVRTSTLTFIVHLCLLAQLAKQLCPTLPRGSADICVLPSVFLLSTPMSDTFGFLADVKFLASRV